MLFDCRSASANEAQVIEVLHLGRQALKYLTEVFQMHYVEYIDAPYASDFRLMKLIE
jgi:hypothetical protein